MNLFLCRDRCEKGVMSSVNVRNCIRFYQTAEELNATTLMNYCGEIIASHWVSTFKQTVFVTCMHVLCDFFFFFISHVLWDLNHFFSKFWIPLSLPFWQLSVSVWLSSGYNLIIYSTINPARPQLSNFRVIFITSGVGNGCCRLSLLHFIFLLAQVLLLHFRKARNSSA